MRYQIHRVSSSRKETFTQKKVLLISGVHGDEITPIFCLKSFLEECCKFEQFFTRFFPQVDVLLNANPSALSVRARSKEESKTFDMNRALSNIVYEENVEELRELCKQYDIVIDVHSSPNISELFLIDTDKGYSRLASYFIEQRDIPFVLSRKKPYTTLKTFVNELSSENGEKLGLTLELNAMKVIDKESALRGKCLLLNFLNNFYPSYESFKGGSMFFPEDYCYEVFADCEGIIEFHNEAQSVYKDNEEIAIIRDINTNEVLQRISLRKKSFVFYKCGNTYVHPGSGPIIEVQPFLCGC